MLHYRVSHWSSPPRIIASVNKHPLLISARLVGWRFENFVCVDVSSVAFVR